MNLAGGSPPEYLEAATYTGSEGLFRATRHRSPPPGPVFEGVRGWQAACTCIVRNPWSTLPKDRQGAWD
jgi:hypothetical protein